MVTYDIEVTDTFGGEANYSWVHRYTLAMPDGHSRLALVRRVKLIVGWNGMRARVDDFGDSMDIHPYRANMVCFVVPRY